MRVLLVHGSDAGWGGGETQMLRLQEGLRKRNVDARIICRARTREDSFALPRCSSVEAILGKFTLRMGLNDIHCLGSFKLLKSEAFTTSDVIDFHCIHHNSFSYLALPWLTRSKAAVFTLHDMWPFTGHCHTSLECVRWRTGCGQCPHLDIAPSVQRDATHWDWALKRLVYQHCRLVLISPSEWLAQMARQSILASFPIYVIPHGIDTTVYEPLDRAVCRTLLGIPDGKKVLVFVVDNLKRYLKGGDLLVQAVRRLPSSLKSTVVLCLLGNHGGAFARQVDVQVMNLGYIGSDRMKAIVFSAADLCVHPTRAESFGLVPLESMACGTPVVSFKVGAVPELVRPGLSGYLAERESPDDLCKGIVDLLEDREQLNAMRVSCRSLVLREYALTQYANRYLEVYQRAVEAPALAR